MCHFKARQEINGKNVRVTIPRAETQQKNNVCRVIALWFSHKQSATSRPGKAAQVMWMPQSEARSGGPRAHEAAHTPINKPFYLCPQWVLHLERAERQKEVLLYLEKDQWKWWRASSIRRKVREPITVIWIHPLGIMNIHICFTVEMK